jgi:hypothetical protein
MFLKFFVPFLFKDVILVDNNAFNFDIHVHSILQVMLVV